MSHANILRLQQLRAQEDQVSVDQARHGQVLAAHATTQNAIVQSNALLLQELQRMHQESTSLLTQILGELQRSRSSDNGTPPIV